MRRLVAKRDDCYEATDGMVLMSLLYAITLSLIYGRYVHLLDHLYNVDWEHVFLLRYDYRSNTPALVFYNVIRYLHGAGRVDLAILASTKVALAFPVATFVSCNSVVSQKSHDSQ